MALQHRVFRFLARRLAGRDLPLRLVLPDGATCDFGAAPKVVLRFKSRRALARLCRGDVDRLAECYVEGDLAVEGAVHEVIAIGAALAEALAAAAPRLAALARFLATWRGLLAGKHSRRRDAAAIRYHYDVSNEFYALWLDRNLVYSCAYFHDGTESIDTAQEQKLDHICRKLRLSQGERLLDIGCGWGGLLLWAAQHYGVTGVGVTLSERQCEYARRRIAREGMEGLIEIRLQDYRDIPEDSGFDKIASVGMFEHVGRRNLGLYFRTIDRLLKPGGLALNHGITAMDRESRGNGPAGGAFLDNYVFPDGELAHLSRVLYDMAGAGFDILDVESLRPHYALTLQHWVRRLEEKRAAAIATAGAERYRIWRIFMAGTAHAFDAGLLDLHQVLVAKRSAAGPAPRPWTRAYQYRDEKVPLAGALDWSEDGVSAPASAEAKP